MHQRFPSVQLYEVLHVGDVLPHALRVRMCLAINLRANRIGWLCCSGALAIHCGRGKAIEVRRILIDFD